MNVLFVLIFKFGYCVINGLNDKGNVGGKIG